MHGRRVRSLSTARAGGATPRVGLSVAVAGVRAAVPSAGREALHRSAVHLTRGTVPTMRELPLDLEIPGTCLVPEADGPLPGAQALTEAGAKAVPIPDCGHDIMLDNPEAFARATASFAQSAADPGSVAVDGLAHPRSPS